MPAMRCSGRALALAATFLASTLAAAAAQTPVTDAAHFALNAAWHYIYYLQFALQIYQQTTEIANQDRLIEAQLRALAKLPNPAVARPAAAAHRPGVPGAVGARDRVLVPGPASAKLVVQTLKDGPAGRPGAEIGRASCRERV